jgi:hypothetical protein
MSLRRHIQQAWNSLSYADAGEMLTRREKHRLLGKAELSVLHPGPAAERGQRRAVAIQVGETLTTRVLDYAIETCERLRAELVLLAHGRSDIQDDAVESSTHRVRAAGIHSHVVRLNGEWDQAVTRYVRAHHEIIFLILNALDVNSHALLGKRQARKRHSFPVPLVVVGENPTAALPSL